VEIQDRDRVMAHADVAETVDGLLRGEPISPELRWRDEEGVHRSQSRPRPSPREQAPTDRFAGLTGNGGSWRTEPGWGRGSSSFRTAGYAGEERVPGRPGYRPGASGGWRSGRRPNGEGDPPSGTIPGERFAVPPDDPRGAERPFVA